jgi:outer membrane receptor for ferrienterochelin and colicin
MSRKTSGRLLLLLGCAWSGQAMSQQADTTPRPTLLDATVITATRSSAVVREVPAHISVLGPREIQRTASRTVSDFLRVIPGYTTKDYQSSIVAHPSRRCAASAEPRRAAPWCCWMGFR